MLVPKILDSTIENATNEFFKRGDVSYLEDKIKQLSEENPNLLNSINILSHSLFVENDDSDDNESQINKMRAVALCLVIINLINTQMEIDWLSK